MIALFIDKHRPSAVVKDAAVPTPFAVSRMPVPASVDTETATRRRASHGALSGGGAGALGLGDAPIVSVVVGVGDAEGVCDREGAGSRPTTYMRHAPGHAPSHTKASPVASSTAKHLPYLSAITVAGNPSPA